METKQVSLDGFSLIGYKLETNLQEFNAGIGKGTYLKLLSFREDVKYKKSDNVLLVQVYPQKTDFNPWDDRFIQVLGYSITEEVQADALPEGMDIHRIPPSNYVMGIHHGPESEMQRSYDYLYGQWMKETGNIPKGIDFEIWDEQYKPESQDNVIRIFIAIE